MEEKEEIEGRSNNGLKIIYFPLLSREGTKDDYLIWRDEDDAPETTKLLVSCTRKLTHSLSDLGGRKKQKENLDYDHTHSHDVPRVHALK